MATIKLASVSKRYVVKHKVVIALEDVSFSVADGTFLVLSGPSGSGKSTVLQLISGIEMPTDGQIFIDDVDLVKMSNRQLTDFRRRKVGIVFQQFYLEPTLTIQQNIEVPAMFLGLTKDARTQRTAELAEIMGLKDQLEHLPSEVSGGQIQRAAVARAIYNRPSILIADEPTSNLDHDNIYTIINMFKQVQRMYGTTIIIAAHDQTIVQAADQVVQLSSGKVVV